MAKNEKGTGGEGKSSNDQDKEVKIYSLATTPNECILFLEETTGNRLLPIWIGLAEGQAIAIRFSGLVLPRPLTHDLLLNAIKSLGYSVDKVVINDIKENTFYARIHIHKGAVSHELDSRPSDAIAIAVRAGCAIRVSTRVFEKCQTLPKPITEDEVEKFKSELKSLKPEDIFRDLPEAKKKEDGPAEEKKPPKDKGDKGGEKPGGPEE